MGTRRRFLKYSVRAATLSAVASQGLGLVACGDAGPGSGPEGDESGPVIASDEYVDLLGAWFDAHASDEARAHRLQVDEVKIWGEGDDADEPGLAVEQFSVEFVASPGEAGHDGLYELVDDQGQRRLLYLQNAGERNGAVVMRADFALLSAEA